MDQPDGMEAIPSPALPRAEPSADERARRLAAELEGAFKGRARLYWDLLVTLRDSLGEAEAERLLSAAVERRGAGAGAAVFAGVEVRSPLHAAETFLLRGSPDWGRLFPHSLHAGPDGSARITVHRCPLKEAWEEDGRTPEEVATLCRIAGRADHGVFGATGCGFEAETWVPGREGCCVLHLIPASERPALGR